jgi:acetyl-CoA acetyltransferase
MSSRTTKKILNSPSNTPETHPWRLPRPGGPIPCAHPLGASGARLVTTAVNQLHRSGGRYALCTMCIGVGQGIAMIVERV